MNFDHPRQKSLQHQENILLLVRNGLRTTLGVTVSEGNPIAKLLRWPHNNVNVFDLLTSRYGSCCIYEYISHLHF